MCIIKVTIVSMSGVSTMSFVLEKKAKNAGGDKYVCNDNNKFSIYFPQTVSRNENGECFQTLNVNFDQNNQNGFVFVFNIEKKAKNAGGDKFICNDNDKFSIYFPQTVSRNENGECFQTLNVSVSCC